MRAFVTSIADSTILPIMNHQSYRDLPPLAGLCTLAQAARPGLMIESCVSRLKRYHYAFKRLHEIFTARITAEPIYELKTAFSLHAYLCAEHMMSLRARVGEMREPPLGLDAVPSEPLQIFFDEILAAPDTAPLLVGLYEKAIPALDAALAQHLEETNHLADAPSVRLIRFARLELADLIAFGGKAIQQLVAPKHRQAMSHWLALLDDCLFAAGQLDGATTATKKTLVRQYSAKPNVPDYRPRRDERFPDPWNQGVNPEAFLYDSEMPARAKTLMLYFRRLRASRGTGRTGSTPSARHSNATRCFISSSKDSWARLANVTKWKSASPQAIRWPLCFKTTIGRTKFCTRASDATGMSRRWATPPRRLPMATNVGRAFSGIGARCSNKD